MDQTSRPLLIPPEFALYAEKHGVFDLYQVCLYNTWREFLFHGIFFFKRLLKQLIIHKPDEPIQFLIDFVKRDANCKFYFLN